MFEDLHDPDPPGAGLDTLAAVSKRARQLRRRRSLVAGGGGVALVALAIGTIVMPGRDRSMVAPADEARSASPASTIAPMPDCGRLTDPVWLPNGSVAGTPEVMSGIDPFSDERVDGRLWVDSKGLATLVQLRASAEVFDLPRSGQMWDLRIRDAPTVDSLEVTIWRHAGNCVARFLAPGDVETVTTWAAAFVDQLTIAASAEGPVTGDSGLCSVILGRRVACLDPGRIDAASANGPVAASYEVLNAEDSGLLSVLRGRVGVVQLLVGTDDIVSPVSRLAFETFVDGRTDLKSVVDFVPAADVWCGQVTRADGDVSAVEAHVLPTGGGGAGGRCPESGSGPQASTSSSSSSSSSSSTTTPHESTPPTNAVAPSVVRPIVAINGDGDAVVFGENNAATVVRDGADPDDSPPAEGPTAFIDGVAVSPDGSTVVVGICCEPSAGSLFAGGRSSGANDFITYGHLPAFSIYGNLVWTAFGPLQVGFADGAVATTLLDLDPSQWTVLDLAVVQRGTEPEEVLVLTAGRDGTYLHRVFLGGGDMRLTRKVSDAVWPDATQLSLAGYSADSFFVLDDANDRLIEFDGFTLQAKVVPDFSELSISLWMTPTGVRGISPDRRLIVDGVAMPGEYLWVR